MREEKEIVRREKSNIDIKGGKYMYTRIIEKNWGNCREFSSKIGELFDLSDCKIKERID